MKARTTSAPIIIPARMPIRLSSAPICRWGIGLSIGYEGAVLVVIPFSGVDGCLLGCDASWVPSSVLTGIALPLSWIGCFLLRRDFLGN